MSVRVRFRQPPLRGVLFVLLLLCGLAPLMVVDAMLVGAAPRDGRLVETGLIVGLGLLLAGGLAWFLSAWAAAILVEPARRLSEGFAGLAGGRFDTWVPPAESVRELAELSDSVNRMTAMTAKRVRQLERDKRDGAALATDAMRLFRQAVQAKEPLTKHQPGLLEAYSKAVARQLGDRAGAVASEEISLSPFTDPDTRPRSIDTRSQPRYQVADLLMQAPVGAKVFDVGANGMGLETMEKLPLGRQDTFELVARSRRLRISGRVAWCRLVRTVKTSGGDLVPVYRAGVRFAEAAALGLHDELLEIIRTHRQVA